jgi:hypothetical protein
MHGPHTRIREGQILTVSDRSRGNTSHPGVSSQEKTKVNDLEGGVQVDVALAAVTAQSIVRTRRRALTSNPQDLVKTW